MELRPSPGQRLRERLEVTGQGNTTHGGNMHTHGRGRALAVFFPRSVEQHKEKWVWIEGLLESAFALVFVFSARRFHGFLLYLFFPLLCKSDTT